MRDTKNWQAWTDKDNSMNDFNVQLSKCNEILKAGGIIVYPTATLWALGCDATNQKAVERVKELKGSTDEPLICLVNNQALLERCVVQVPEVAYDIMDLALKPTTIVFDNPKGFAPNCCHYDGSIAIRVANTKFCAYLVGALKKPIVATMANFYNGPYPKKSTNIPSQILESVDYVVNLQNQIGTGEPSAIIKLGNSGTVRVIRK